MKRFDGWLTLTYAVLSLLLIALTFFYSQPMPAIAAAVCWGFGFAWFVSFGRLARGGKRRLYGIAFYLLCLGLLACLGLCVFLVYSWWRILV